MLRHNLPFFVSLESIRESTPSVFERFRASVTVPLPTHGLNVELEEP